MNKKNIFKWLFVYVLLLVAGVTSAVAQSLTIADFQIKAGETKTVTIKLDKGSLADVYSVQADIAFSDGLSLDGDPELISGVLSGGTLAFNTFTSGVTRISALSMSGKTFTAEEIINLPVKAAENFERGTITLSNIEFAITNTGQTFKPENSTTAVTKEEEQQGEEVEAQWVAKDKGYSNGDEVTESVIDNNVSVTFNKGTGSNAPKYYTTGEAVRVYGGGNFTIASTTATIVKIELTFGTGDGNNEITTDVASYENGTWTGEAQSVKFTVGGTSGNRRIAGITVTYKGGSDVPPTPITVAAPTFSVPEGTYTEAQTVTLACETEGAAIYYTLDGTDPTAESTLYEAPITISTTTTVKAIAIKDDVLSALFSPFSNSFMKRISILIRSKRISCNTSREE